MFHLLLFLLGLVSATIGSAIGIGGGSIVVPILITFFALMPCQAVPGSLLMIVTTSLVATLNYLKYRLVDIKLGLFLELFTVPGAILGARLNYQIDYRVFEYIMVGVLLLSALRVFLSQDKIVDISGNVGGRAQGIRLTVVKYMLAMALAFTAGLASGLLGIGGGVLKVPLMIVLGIPIKVAVATSSFMIGITSISALATYLINNYIDLGSFLKIGLPLMLGALVGANLGPRITRYLPERYLRITFALILVSVALRLLMNLI